MRHFDPEAPEAPDDIYNGDDVSLPYNITSGGKSKVKWFGIALASVFSCLVLSAVAGATIHYNRNNGWSEEEELAETISASNYNFPLADEPLSTVTPDYTHTALETTTSTATLQTTSRIIVCIRYYSDIICKWVD